MVSTATDIIHFHGLPAVAKRCHKFPNHQLVDPLLSLGKLTEHGCRIIFKQNIVEVTNSNGLLILEGQKPVGWNIYTVPLPLGQPQNIPQNIPQTLQFITPVKVPKNSQDKLSQLPKPGSELPKLGPEVIPAGPGVFSTVSHYVTGHSNPRLEKPGSENP